MIKRDIKNYLGAKIGELEFPDGTSELKIAQTLASYAHAPLSQNEQAESYLEYSIKSRKDFADDLLERFKKRNILEGINASQGFWMHHTLRSYPVTFMGQQRVIDIMNLAISGDLEIACLALIYGYTDDMSESYHWISGDRKAWLIAEIKKITTQKVVVRRTTRQDV